MHFMPALVLAEYDRRKEEYYGGEDIQALLDSKILLGRDSAIPKTTGTRHFIIGASTKPPKKTGFYYGRPEILDDVEEEDMAPVDQDDMA